FSMPPPPARTASFPYTTLFRSHVEQPEVSGKTRDTQYTDQVLQRLISVPHPHAFRRDQGKILPTQITVHQVTRHQTRDIGLHDLDRKSTRLNSSHVKTSYAVFC